MKQLKMGKFYRTASGHYLWKTDRRAPELIDSRTRKPANAHMTILLPDTLVMVTKRGKFRYVQVVYEDMIGYIWCSTNVPIYEHFRELDTENEEELQRKPRKLTQRERVRS
jgi:hypothetical protein